MMSLLLTFFIMLVSMSEIVADKKYRAILESLHSRMGYQMSEAGPPGKNFPLNSVTQRATISKLGSVSDDKGHGGIRTNATDGEDKRVSNMPDGSGRQVGQAIRFSNESGQLTTSSEVACERYALELRGKPNKLEIRSWIAAEPIDDRKERVLTAFDRAETVRGKLLAAGVEPERVRLAVVPSPNNSELINSELSRYGVVTVTVMDAYTRDYAGRPE